MLTSTCLTYHRSWKECRILLPRKLDKTGAWLKEHCDYGYMMMMMVLLLNRYGHKPIYKLGIARSEPYWGLLGQGWVSMEVTVKMASRLSLTSRSKRTFGDCNSSLRRSRRQPIGTPSKVHILPLSRRSSPTCINSEPAMPSLQWGVSIYIYRMMRAPNTLFLFMRNKLHHNFPTSQDYEAPDISLGPISHMFAYRLLSSMSYPNSQCLFSMLESNLRSSLVLTTASSSFL